MVIKLIICFHVEFHIFSAKKKRLAANQIYGNRLISVILKTSTKYFFKAPKLAAELERDASCSFNKY